MASFHRRRILSKMETRWERSVFRERWKQRKNDGGANPRLRILYSNRCPTRAVRFGNHKNPAFRGRVQKVRGLSRRAAIPNPSTRTGNRRHGASADHGCRELDRRPEKIAPTSDDTGAGKPWNEIQTS